MTEDESGQPRREVEQKLGLPHAKDQPPSLSKPPSSMAEPWVPQSPDDFNRAASFYELVGGAPTFERLVDAFYDGVAEDPVLRPMYPAGDLAAAKRRLTMFLEQYWGGPQTYSDERGHPRLRMRHQPFRVNPDARDRWITHMRAAVDTLDLAPMHRSTLMDYLERAAHSMVNTFDDSPAP